MGKMSERGKIIKVGDVKSKLKILIVEDNEKEQYLLESVLKGIGHDVVSASNGEEALKKLLSIKVDMIISDILMPVMDGFCLCQKVRENDVFGDIPFIFYTATYTDKRDEELALNIGADAYIRKPIEVNDFIHILDGLISNMKQVKRADKKKFHDDAQVLKLYNERLVNKLEKKIVDLKNEIARRKQAEEQIRASLKEKDLLFMEIHHRVKNNMQIIITLLKLQAENTDNEHTKTVLRECQDRILAMAFVHEILYSSRNLACIDLKTYVSRLAESIFESYGMYSDRIALNIGIEEIELGLDQATPLGLLINEIVSNALKYAFPGDMKGEIIIIIRETGDREIEVMVSDNGVGIPKELDPLGTHTLGFQLITTLVRYQLEGSITINRKCGTCFLIRFKKEKRD